MGLVVSWRRGWGDRECGTRYRAATPLRKISMYLAHYHGISNSSSGVWHILKRLELNRLPANQRHKTHDLRASVG